MKVIKSESDKVTIEYTLEELSGVENDLAVYVDCYDDITGDTPSDATYEFLEQTKAFWISCQLETPFAWAKSIPEGFGKKYNGE